jgi:cobalt-zinc-cadmium efflux system outer membrane protein
VHLRFYDALVAQRRVELTGQLARIGDDLVRSAQKLLDARVGTENDLLQAQIRADESQLLHDTARNGHREAWQRLSAVIGLPNLQQSRLTGALDADLPIFDWDHCYAMVLGSNPQLGAAHARAERANIAIERARRENIPDVNVFLSMRHNNITSSDVANVEIGIPIPIRNRNQGNIRAAEAEWIASSQEVKRIELYLQDRLAVAYRRYANARERIDAYGQRIVPRAKRSLDLVREGYDRRQVEYLTLLTAQQTYYQVNLSYLDAMGELWAASSEIEGQLLTDSLSATD